MNDDATRNRLPDDDPTRDDRPRDDPCPSHRLRSDARANRAKLLAAAREIFAEAGLDAPLEAIAERAGVGIATLYRRFPRRQDLLAALVDEEVDGYLSAVRYALADPDPWHGFQTYLETLCRLQAEEPGLRDALTLDLPGNQQIKAKRAELRALMGQLVERAQAHGSLRPDITPEDLALAVWSNAGVVAATNRVVPDAWRRWFGLMLDAFRAEGAHPLPRPPLSQRQTYRSSRRWGRRRSNDKR